MRALVTIGTDEVWAPPRMCGFEVTDDFALVNRNRVSWDIAAEGFVTRWAMRWTQGWVAIALPEPVEVDRWRTPAMIAPGALRVEIHPPGEILGRELPSAVAFPLIELPEP